MTLYASTAQIKAALRIADTVDDSLISMAGSAASGMIDTYCQRTFGQTFGTRVYSPDTPFICQIDDLVQSGSVTINLSTNLDGVYDITITTNDYQLEPLNAIMDGTPWPATRIRAVGSYLWGIGDWDYYFQETPTKASMQVIGTFGWPAVPAAITQAAVLQAARIYKRTDSPLGVAGFGDLGAIRVSRGLDPDVAMLVAPYVRERVA
jgi:hypothetical protein